MTDVVTPILVEGASSVYGYMSGPRIFTLSRIFVPVAFRRQGVGTRLMTKLCLWADEGRLEIHLDARPLDDSISMTSLVEFYESFDFERYAGRSRNAVFMVRKPKVVAKTGVES